MKKKKKKKKVLELKMDGVKPYIGEDFFFHLFLFNFCLDRIKGGKKFIFNYVSNSRSFFFFFFFWDLKTVEGKIKREKPIKKSDRHSWTLKNILKLFNKNFYFFFCKKKKKKKKKKKLWNENCFESESRLRVCVTLKSHAPDL